MIERAESVVLLTLAWFAAVNLLCTPLAWLIGRHLLTSRLADRAALLLSVRLLPAGVSAVVAAAIFAPAHWLLEPPDAGETHGVLVYALALGATALLVRSASRGAAALLASRRLGHPTPNARALTSTVLYEVAGLAGMSLAGVWRPRVLVDPDVSRQLTHGELDVAVSHELAHRGSFDNLKRLATVCAPDIFGWSAIARRLEDEWRAAAEVQADARAVDGDRQRAVDLASALVKVARLGTIGVMHESPAWSPLHDTPLLEQRVRRLLDVDAPRSTQRPAAHVATATAFLLVSVATIAALTGGTLHDATEAIIRWLP